MIVLRLNLHFDLVSDADLPTAIRELADFMEQPSNRQVTPPICDNCTYNAFQYNRSKGCRLTGSAAVCTIVDGNKWISKQEGIVDQIYTIQDNDFTVVK